MTQTNPPQAMDAGTRENLLFDYIGRLMKLYMPTDRLITPENVFQPGLETGRALFEELMGRFLLPGSTIEGTAHLDHCLKALEQGKRVLFLPEHRGNFDVPSFNHLLRQLGPRYQPIQDKLVYIAGRKLNESSDLVKMFTEKYSRLVIVPRRDLPTPKPNESGEERQKREEYEAEASRINRAAFRSMQKLKKEGYVFVLFPLGGRYKPGSANEPVREVSTYLRSFDVAFPISMDGNLLPIKEVMETERPVQDKVVFRVGPPLEGEAFLEGRHQAFEQAQSQGLLAPGMEEDLYVVNQIMAMLANLREFGEYRLDQLPADGSLDANRLDFIPHPPYGG